jgi:ABC-2 type transporter.
MRTYMMKDLLLYWRNRREIAIGLLLPIVLVLVLNVVFSDLLGSEDKPMALTLAVVIEDDGSPEAGRLLEDLRSPALAKWLSVAELPKPEALRQVESGDVDGALVISRGYAESLSHADAREGAAGARLPLIVKGYSTKATALEGLIRDLADQVNFERAIAAAADGDAGMTPPPTGGRELLEGAQPFTMAQYFTIAIGALFGLFIASTIGERTGGEKREQVFNRVLLSNSRPLDFLKGKTASAFLMIWMQFAFVVLVSRFSLGVFSGKTAHFWMGMLAMITLHAAALAGLAALFASITLRARSIDAASGLFLTITMVFGTLGGGFAPIHFFPGWLQRIGEWTPNGRTLAMATEWIQFEDWSALTVSFAWLLAFALAMLLAGIRLYPGRGDR